MIHENNDFRPYLIVKYGHADYDEVVDDTMTGSERDWALGVPAEQSCYISRRCSSWGKGAHLDYCTKLARSEQRAGITATVEWQRIRFRDVAHEMPGAQLARKASRIPATPLGRPRVDLQGLV